jgi:hypothetical protein
MQNPPEGVPEVGMVKVNATVSLAVGMTLGHNRLPIWLPAVPWVKANPLGGPVKGRVLPLETQLLSRLSMVPRAPTKRAAVWLISGVVTPLLTSHWKTVPESALEVVART